MRYVLLFVLLPLLAPAQSTKNVMRQDLFWVRYQNQLTISPRWLLQTEIDNRMFVKPVKEHHLVLRTQARYRLAEQVQAGGGITYALQHPQDPHSKSELVVPELRGQQDITLKQAIGKASLSHRYMLEERFIRKVQDGELLPGYNFNFRIRYRLQAEVPLLKKDAQQVELVVYDEVMVNAGKSISLNTFDQNRIYGGMKWTASPAWALEAGYLYWFQQRTSGKDFFSRDIARVSVYHKLTLKKNDK